MKLVITGKNLEIYRSLVEYGISALPLPFHQLTQNATASRQTCNEDDRIRRYWDKHHQVPDEFKRFVEPKQ